VTVALTPLATALANWLDGVVAVAPRRVPLDEAEGLISAERLAATAPMPLAATALRGGWAVTAADTVGASAYGPVQFGSAPSRVEPGAELPPGADAVAPLESVTPTGRTIEIAEAISPGHWTRRIGEDLAHGAVILAAGQRIGALQLAVARAAESGVALVTQPSVSIEGAGERSPAAALLATWIRAFGAAVTRNDGSACSADLRVVLGDPGGISPSARRRGGGERARLEARRGGPAGAPNARPIVLMPDRLDVALTVALVVLRPALARLSNGRERSILSAPAPLTRKIASTVGLAEIVLLRREADGYAPQAVGDLPLSAIAGATIGYSSAPGARAMVAASRSVRNTCPDAGAMNRPDPTTFATSADQEQFLHVLSRDEALARFEAALRPQPLGVVSVPLANALGRVLAEDLTSRIDVPPFDRALVDGFAVRSTDIAAASETSPTLLTLNEEVLQCGVAPTIAVRPATATAIATGAPLPRGADCVAMVETTEPADNEGAAAIEVRRPLAAGAFMAFAGSDIAAGETVVRRGTLVTAREIGVLAAAGFADVPVWLQPRVGIISTGDELVPPGEALRPGAIYDSNGPIIAAAVIENGGLPVPYGSVPDRADRLADTMRHAHAECDMVILSGGTSKGAGDLTYRLVAELGVPGIVAHGVALKPGKPLLLAVCDGKAVVVLPGFPTSAMFTFHDMVAPTLRRLAGLPDRREATMTARLPARVPSELGRTEYVMVSLVESEDGLAAYPLAKGSGSVTAFSQADGFVTIEALADAAPAGAAMEVRLFSPHLAAPDLVVMGSHCLGLDALVSRLADDGFATRVMAIGSQGGLAAARRGACDLAPIHLLDPDTNTYNLPFLSEGLELVTGWRRLQGVIYRPADSRFANRTAEDAIEAALGQPGCQMVNRNSGSGTRVLIDRLVGEARPDGYSNQPSSHNAVAAAVAQCRADWGVAIEPVATRYGLGFLPLEEEHYDFALRTGRRERPGVRAFLKALDEPAFAAKLLELGFRRSSPGQPNVS
jgi:putative molybdopterin biosynthesis protein